MPPTIDHWGRGAEGITVLCDDCDAVTYGVLPGCDECDISVDDPRVPLWQALHAVHDFLKHAPNRLTSDWQETRRRLTERVETVLP